MFGPLFTTVYESINKQGRFFFFCFYLFQLQSEMKEIILFFALTQFCVYFIDV